MEDQTQLWHRRAGHLNLKHLKYLHSHQLVNGLPKIANKAPSPCVPCQQGKQKHVPNKLKLYVSTSQCLKHLHLNFVRPVQTKSLSGKKYMFVIVEDYLKFTWVLFLVHKSGALEVLKRLSTMITNEKNSN